MPTTMQFEMVTAERQLFAGEVESLVAPGAAGDLGILPHHAPLLTTLRPGELRILHDGQERSIALTGGFLEVLDNRVTILADAAEQADEIVLERAEQAMQRAQERIAARDTDLDLQQALAALRRAQARVTVARRRRSRSPNPNPSPGASE